MSSIPPRGFRDSFRSYIPAWLQNRKDRNVGYKILYAAITPLDFFLQWAIEGVRAAWPGVGTTTALPAIGRSRGIVRGETESDASYSARLVGWLDSWTQAGSAELAKAIHYYLGNNPKVRIIDRGGRHWVTCNTDGSITKAFNVAFDWDSISNPERSGYWSELFVIVYPTEWAITGSSLSSLVGLWGTHQLGIGHAVPRAAVDAILGLVALWKGAHTYVRAIVWSYDSTLFDPSNPTATGNPDGKWGIWAKDDGAGNQVPSRNSNCRYWEPANG